MLATQYLGKEKDLLYMYILLSNFHQHLNRTETIVYDLKS